MTILPPNVIKLIDESVASRIKQLADKTQPSQPTIQEISDGLHKQIKELRKEVRATVEKAEADQEGLLTKYQTQLAYLEQRINALDLRLTEYIEKDRYQITRAQVLKAMREAPNE